MIVQVFLWIWTFLLLESEAWFFLDVLLLSIYYLTITSVISPITATTSCRNVLYGLALAAAKEVQSNGQRKYHPRASSASVNTSLDVGSCGQKMFSYYCVMILSPLSLYMMSIKHVAKMHNYLTGIKLVFFFCLCTILPYYETVLS